MTIKRKLFLSNILMIIIPVLLTVLIALCLVFAYMSISGTESISAISQRAHFNTAMRETDALAEKWADDPGNPALSGDIEAFNQKYEGTNYICIYVNGRPLFADLSFSDTDLLYTLLRQQSGAAVIKEDFSVYCVVKSGLHIIMTDNGYTLSGMNSGGVSATAGFWTATFLILLVVATSWLLSKFFSRSITKPLDMLIRGVHEIGSGNLEYRIAYAGKDEYAAVCEDFNEMAGRLARSVEQRQKDETNRKELIAGISHDLRTPLTSIKAYVEGLEKGVAATPQLQKKYIRTVKNKAGELERIIDQLFFFSKIDIGEFPFRLETVDIVKDLQSFLSSAADEYEGRGLRISIAPFLDESVFANIDTAQFRNVLTNIFENSVKYKEKDTGNMRVSAETENGSFVLTLTDDGPGVPDDALDKLFDVFYRCDPSRNNKKSGSGLGLAIAAKVIEKFGGSVKAENAVGGGLSLRIILKTASGEST